MSFFNFTAPSQGDCCIQTKVHCLVFNQVALCFTAAVRLKNDLAEHKEVDICLCAAVVLSARAPTYLVLSSAVQHLVVADLIH